MSAPEDPDLYGVIAMKASQITHTIARRAGSTMMDLLVRLVGWRATVLLRYPSALSRMMWLKRHIQYGPIRTLDAGCGVGTFAIYASTIGNECVGIDASEQIHTARNWATILGLSDIEFVHIDIRELEKYTDQLGQFDQILCLETIEHILDDKKLLRDLSVLLKAGGRLLLTTPWKYHKPLVNEMANIRPYETGGGHVRFGYTHDEMKELFERCGLDVTVSEYVIGFISQQLDNFEYLVRERYHLIARFVAYPLRVFQIFDDGVTRYLDYPYVSLGVVGVKRCVPSRRELDL